MSEQVSERDLILDRIEKGGPAAARKYDRLAARFDALLARVRAMPCLCHPPLDHECPRCVALREAGE